jgi:hypothetical protein
MTAPQWRKNAGQAHHDWAWLCSQIEEYLS